MSVVGIDLGTTNTVVSCVRAGKVHVLADARGARLLPSVVSFHPNGEVLVGADAKARRLIDPTSTVYSHKRLLGRSWGSPEIAEARQRFAFELREGPGQAPVVRARGKDYSLPEISAFVLKRAKQIAEAALGEQVTRAVITVPAHFNELQRASTKVAGRVAGLEVLRILNEPTAAALAYGLGRSGNERIAVYDFGGGTFDCTLLDLSGNVFEVLATAGDSFLGGDDVDQAIAERMADAFLAGHRVDARADRQTFERLRAGAEEMKIALSTAETHTVILQEIAHGIGGSSIHLNFTMTRRELEALVAPLVERTFKVTQDALALARLTPTSFDRVILVGGSTRIPLVRQRVEAFFGAPPQDRVNPDEVVAVGAAIQASALTERGPRRSLPAPPPVPATRPRQPTVPHGGGLPSFDDGDVTQTGVDVPTLTAAAPVTAPIPPHLTAPMHPAFTAPMPTRPPAPPPAFARPPTLPPPLAHAPPPPPSLPRAPEFSFPPAALAGAAPVLVDVTPRALVVETVGGFTDTVITRNAKIPCERTRRFGTSRDGQTQVRVRVAQGEAKAFADNTYLGELELSGLRPAPRGAVPVAVTFEVDADGTLRVRARDEGTGQEARAVLRLVGVADEAAIAAMMQNLGAPGGSLHPPRDPSRGLP